jgi:hypothetical protein
MIPVCVFSNLLQSVITAWQIDGLARVERHYRHYFLCFEIQTNPNTLTPFVHCNLWWYVEIVCNREFLFTDL